jgi:hypothetical protein
VGLAFDEILGLGSGVDVDVVWVGLGFWDLKGAVMLTLGI